MHKYLKFTSNGKPMYTCLIVERFQYDTRKTMSDSVMIQLMQATNMPYSMADGISFDVSLSLNCTDFTNAEEEFRNRTLTSRFWKLESGLYAPPSLVIPRKWLLHHRKVTRYSCNLNIGVEHKHTVQTQIRLCRPKSDCSI